MLRRASRSDLSDGPRHGTMRSLLAVRATRFALCLAFAVGIVGSPIGGAALAGASPHSAHQSVQVAGHKAHHRGGGGGDNSRSRGWGGGGRHQSVTVKGTVASVGTDTFTLTGTTLNPDVDPFDGDGKRDVEDRYHGLWRPSWVLLRHRPRRCGPGHGVPIEYDRRREEGGNPGRH